MRSDHRKYLSFAGLSEIFQCQKFSKETKVFHGRLQIEEQYPLDATRIKVIKGGVSGPKSSFLVLALE